MCKIYFSTETEDNDHNVLFGPSFCCFIRSNRSENQTYTFLLQFKCMHMLVFGSIWYSITLYELTSIVAFSSCRGSEGQH